MNGVNHIIIRKLVSAVMACILVMLIYFLLDQTGFVIILGMYLLPILLTYGITASILSDFVTKNLRGFIRASLALLMHFSLATLFIVIPILLLDWERELLLSDFSSLFNNFFFITSLLSSVLFYCSDEFLRSKMARKLHLKIRGLWEKIGDMRI